MVETAVLVVESPVSELTVPGLLAAMVSVFELPESALMLEPLVLELLAPEVPASEVVPGWLSLEPHASEVPVVCEMLVNEESAEVATSR